MAESPRIILDRDTEHDNAVAIMLALASAAAVQGLWFPVSSGRRRRFWRYMERYVLNPQVRMGMRLGLAPRSLAVLETTGRRSGQLRRTPVGNGLDGGTFWLVAEHGPHCDYVHNLTANPRVRVMANGEWRSGTAHALPDDDGFARRRRIDAANGLSGRIDGWIFVRSATTPMSIRVDLDSGQQSTD